MKTTVRIDDELVPAVEDLARKEGRTFDEMVAELTRRSLASHSASGEAADQQIPAFDVPPDAETITLEMVKSALDEP